MPNYPVGRPQPVINRPSPQPTKTGVLLEHLDRFGQPRHSLYGSGYANKGEGLARMALADHRMRQMASQLPPARPDFTPEDPAARKAAYEATSAPISKQYAGGTVSYGLGGAAMKFGSNLVQNIQDGKKLGDGLLKGTLQGVGKAAITPGSGIGAGAELAGNLLQGTNNSLLQKVGQGLDVASNFAPGGGGIKGAVGDVANLAQNAGILGGGAANAINAVTGQAGGQAGGQQPGGNNILNTAQNLLGGGANGGGGNFLNFATNLLSGEAGLSVPNKITNQNNMKFSYGAGGYSAPRFSANNGNITSEKRAQASQILANMSNEERIAKFGGLPMSEDQIIDAIAATLPDTPVETPYQPETKAGGDNPAEYIGSAQHYANVKGVPVKDGYGPDAKVVEPEAWTLVKDPITGEMISTRELESRQLQRANKGNRSLAGMLWDEATQIGEGLRVMDQRMNNRANWADEGFNRSTPGPSQWLADFTEGYNREEELDRERREAGALNVVDQYNPFSILSDLIGQKGSYIEKRGQTLEEAGDPFRSGGQRMFYTSGYDAPDTPWSKSAKYQEQDEEQFGGRGYPVLKTYSAGGYNHRPKVSLLKRGRR